MSTSAGEQSDAVADRLLRASRALVAVAARSIASVDDRVTLPQFRALVVLASRGPQNVGVLADELAVHPSTASRMCDRLEARGLVVRVPSPASRREVRVDLSASGRRLLRRVTAARLADLRRIVERIPEKQRPTVAAAFDLFSDAAGEVPDQAWAGWESL
jgi:DNA-binding MarR family transcriptional regulator